MRKGRTASQSNMNEKKKSEVTTVKKRSVLIACTAAALVIFGVIGVMYGCVPTYDVEELPSAAAKLIESSYEINTIFFGEGLPTIGYDDDGDELMGDRYSALSEDSPCKSEAEIREATLQVYTEDYCNFLFEKAFIGQQIDFGEDDTVSELVQIPARYLTYDGQLIVRYVDDDECITLNRTYDTSNIRVKKTYRKKAVITVDSFVDGVPAGEESFTLEYTSAGWRLDDPTY